jgi:hypothetical protein
MVHATTNGRSCRNRRSRACFCNGHLPFQGPQSSSELIALWQALVRYRIKFLLNSAFWTSGRRSRDGSPSLFPGGGTFPQCQASLTELMEVAYLLWDREPATCMVVTFSPMSTRTVKVGIGIACACAA